MATALEEERLPFVGPAGAALFEHQRVGIPWLQARPDSLLADEGGLGKTLQEIAAGVEPMLVLAPAMVLDSGTWDDEIEKWAPGADITQCAYTSLTRYDGRRPTTFLRPEYKRHWGTVIADEAHYIKSRGKKEAYWTTGIRRLERDRLRLATGTPIPNWAQEAFNHLQFIYPEKSRPGQQFGSYWRWAAEWFHVGPKLNRRGEILVRKAVHGFREDRTWEEFYLENWGDRMLMRLREECLDLPELTIQEWRVTMDAEQRRVYKALRDDFVAWLEDGTEVVAWNEAAQSVKLAKCATGLDALDPEQRGSAKLDALEQILEDRPRPTLAVGFFRNTVAACAERARKVGAEVEVIDGGTSRKNRRERSRAFARGDLHVMCATIDTIREGMNYQAADQVVRVERSWLPSRNKQVVWRLHRMGQERPVTCIDLVTRGTTDVGQLAVLEEKSDEQVRALGTAELRALAFGE